MDQSRLSLSRDWSLGFQMFTFDHCWVAAKGGKMDFLVDKKIEQYFRLISIVYKILPLSETKCVQLYTKCIQITTLIWPL